MAMELIFLYLFPVVTVFDVSQTEGRELPTLGVNELTGEVEGYDLFFKALDESCPVPIRFDDLTVMQFLPCLISSYQTGIRLLHGDQDNVIERIIVKFRHQ